MATRAKTACRKTGCTALLDEPGYCEQHQAQVRKQSDEQRGNANQRGYGRKWQKARADYLAENPLCVKHERRGLIVPATEVDHIEAHKLGEALESGNDALIRIAQKLFWDRNNWQSLCKTCHSKKTAKENGGFGRNPRGVSKV